MFGTDSFTGSLTYYLLTTLKYRQSLCMDLALPLDMGAYIKLKYLVVIFIMKNLLVKTSFQFSSHSTHTLYAPVVDLIFGE